VEAYTSAVDYSGVLVVVVEDEYYFDYDCFVLGY
jgi:hypothetical protein